MSVGESTPLVSVIVLNYNGAPWLERCLQSLREQTIFGQIEILVADNDSPDKSGQLAETLLRDFPNARVIQNGANLGFSEGNNRAAAAARGTHLFLLNNDTWLERDCLEKLLDGIKRSKASAAGPLVLNYHDNSFQSMGAKGFDIFGLPTARQQESCSGRVLMPEGCAYLVETAIYHQLGGLDPVFFMFAEEWDFSWRLWIAGYQAVAIPGAVMHHRGAAQVNPSGGAVTSEFRTSDTKRFYANRNALLTLLKNGRNVVLLLAFFQAVMLLFEAAAALILIRRWSFLRQAYFAPFADCWRLRRHISHERKRIQSLRKLSDFRMLRFLRLRMNRWDELQKIRQMGVPKVTPTKGPA